MYFPWNYEKSYLIEISINDNKILKQETNSKPCDNKLFNSPLPYIHAALSTEFKLIPVPGEMKAASTRKSSCI